MAYDEGLLSRIRTCVAKRKGVSETKLFGGIAIMINGNMAVAIRGEDLIVRLGEHGAGKALHEPHVRVMDVTGRVMKTYVTVGADGLKTDEALKSWIDRGIDFARTLPAK